MQCVDAVCVQPAARLWGERGRPIPHTHAVSGAARALSCKSGSPQRGLEEWLPTDPVAACKVQHDLLTCSGKCMVLVTGQCEWHVLKDSLSSDKDSSREILAGFVKHPYKIMHSPDSKQVTRTGVNLV